MHHKKHHYVPKFYLDYFAAVQPGDTKPMLWVYDKQGDAPRKQSPKGTAAINHLYRTSVPEVASDALEIAFSKHESRVAPILSLWGKPGVIPEIPDMKEVSIFLALLHLRNPKTALWYEAMAETISLERAKAAARDSDLFDKCWEMLVAKETIPANLTKEGLREALLKADEYFTVKFDREYITVSPLQHADCVDDELRKMYWCLCSAPPKYTFITCDSPVVVRFSTGKGVAFGGGFGHPTATITFPISPNVCLYLSRTLNRKAVTLTPEAVKKMNRRMAINAERHVFASEKSAGVEKLVEKYSITRSLPRIDSKELIESFRSRGKIKSGA